jgi:hypothetical protein
MRLTLQSSPHHTPCKHLPHQLHSFLLTRFTPESNTSISLYGFAVANDARDTVVVTEHFGSTERYNGAQTHVK